MAWATALVIAADLLEAAGRDGLAITARTTAHLLHLIAEFLRQDDQK